MKEYPKLVNFHGKRVLVQSRAEEDALFPPEPTAEPTTAQVALAPEVYGHNPEETPTDGKA